jgi:hypothetical protein
METIIIPVRPGIMAPPKNRSIQTKLETMGKELKKGIITAQLIPIEEKRRTK